MRAPLKTILALSLLLVLLALGYSISTLPPVELPTSPIFLTNTPSETYGIIETWTKTPSIGSIENSATPTKTPTLAPSIPSSYTPFNVTPTAPTAHATATVREEPTLTPIPSNSPLPSSTKTPTKTPPTNLQACLNTPAATCTLDRNLTVDTTLTISASGVTLACSNGATIKTSASNVGRALTINNGLAVVVQGCSFSRELNTVKSCCGDLILIAHSEDVTLSHVTVCCGVDELLDVVQSTDVDVLYSVLAYPQHCSTHKNGCHGFNALVNNSEVLFDHVLFASGQARLPYCQRSICSVVNSIYFNINGQGLSAVDASVITFQGNIFLSGFNTSDVFYGVVSPNPEDYLEHPQICENGNRLFGERVYRMRRPSDKAYYVECPVVGLPAESEYWVRLGEIGASSPLTETIRRSVIARSGRIVNVPIG